MTGILISVLAFSGVGLLILGERMGLQIVTAGNGTMIILVLASSAFAFAAMTGRFKRFVAGVRNGGRLGLFAMTVAILLTIIGISPEPGLEVYYSASSGMIIGGLFLGLSPWRNFGPDESRGPADSDPSTSSSGALDVAVIAGVALILLTLFRLAPNLFTRLAVTVGIEAGQGAVTMAILIGISVIFGGVLALRSIAVFLVLLVIGVLVAPVFVVSGGDLIARRALIVGNLADIPMEFIRQAGFSLRVERFDLLAATIGLAGGFALMPASIQAGKPVSRALAIFLGLVLAGAVLSAASLAAQHLDQVLREKLYDAAPLRWPFFVFEEGIRGWLSVCGREVDDATAAARSCGLANARQTLPAAFFQVDPSLTSQAASASLGLPGILGALWKLLPLAFGGLAIAIFTHAASTAFVERILYRRINPIAQRAWRLAMTRLTAGLILVGLFFGHDKFMQQDQRLIEWASLGLSGIMLAALIGFVAIELIRFFRRLRSGEAPENRYDLAPLQ